MVLRMPRRLKTSSATKPSRGLARSEPSLLDAAALTEEEVAGEADVHAAVGGQAQGVLVAVKVGRTKGQSSAVEDAQQHLVLRSARHLVLEQHGQGEALVRGPGDKARLDQGAVGGDRIKGESRGR